MEGENVHKVRSEDTIQGICLQHGISEANLRRLNNLGPNESIHSLKYIQLQGAPMQEAPEVEEARVRRELIREFCQESGEGAVEAEFYLQDNNWRIEFALAAWKNDDEAAQGTPFEK